MERLFYLCIILSIAACGLHRKNNTLHMADKDAPFFIGDTVLYVAPEQEAELNEASETQTEDETSIHDWVNGYSVDTNRWKSISNEQAEKVKLQNSRLPLLENEWVHYADSSFVIKTENGTFAFNTQDGMTQDVHNYLGYYALFQMHFIQVIDFNDAVAYLVALDQKTGKQLSLNSPYDGGIGAVLFSPKSDRVIMVSANPFDQESYLSICKIKKNTSNRTIQFDEEECLVIRFRDLLALKWVNNNQMFLATQRKESTESEKMIFEYFTYQLAK